MEKSATLKRLKRRFLCVALSLFLAFGFTANETFGFEFPPDADEPILNETEIALSEKVMNLELAVRTMKTKKKNDISKYSNLSKTDKKRPFHLIFSYRFMVIFFLRGERWK